MKRLLLVALSASALACATAGGRGGAALPPGGARIEMPAPGQPIVAVRLQFRTGSVDDPPGKEGLTLLTAELMAEGGTQKLDAAALQRALYPMAAEIEVVADKETITFSGRCPKGALERFLPILEDVVLHPRFDPHEFERLRSRALDAVEKSLRTEDDEELGKEVLSLALYGGHPYGHPDEGTVQALEKLALGDVVAHWRRVFVSSRLTVGAAGGYAGDLPARLARDLAALPTGSSRRPLPPPHTDAPRFLLVDKDSAPTAVSMGFTWDVRRGDPDFPALVVAVSALGEHRQGAAFRLFKQLREVRGLNYGDYAYPEHFEQAGGSALPAVNHARSYQEFTVWLRPLEPEHRAFAIRAALYEIDRWARLGLTQEELDRVKQFLAGYTLTFEQTSTRRLGYALDDRFYGLQRPWLQSFRERLGSLTLDEVNGAIRRHVDPKRLRIVVATQDADALAAQIRSGAPSPIVYASPKPAAVLAEDKLIERFPFGASGPADVKVVKVDELFEK
jgi:zinc protease